MNINEFINFIDKIAVYLAINLTGYNSEILLKSLANFSSLLANHWTLKCCRWGLQFKYNTINHSKAMGCSMQALILIALKAFGMD